MLLGKKNPHGGDIYSNEITLDFSSNINPYGTPKIVKDRMIRAVDYADRYPDAYCKELRAAVSKHEKADYDCILCGNGASELIYSFADSLDKDKRALIVSPAFSEYESALRSAGILFDRLYPLSIDSYIPGEGILEKNIEEYSSVFISSPNNPTGRCADPLIIEKMLQRGIKVLLDLSFDDLCSIHELFDISSLCKKYSNLFVLKSMTKTYALSGIRLGYMISYDSMFLEKLSEKTQCWNVSCIAQNAGIASFECSRWVSECRKKIRIERERLKNLLENMNIKVFPSDANFLLVFSTVDLYKELLRKKILIRDCSNIPGLRKGYFRISVKTPDEDDILVNALKEVNM